MILDDLRFRKAERLQGRKLIKRLFEGGRSFYIYPFRVLWLQLPEANQFPVKVLVHVPRRNVRNAVGRNRMKRRIREIYRKSKGRFYQAIRSYGITLAVGFIYTGKTLMTSRELEPIINVILQRLTDENVNPTE